MSSGQRHVYCHNFEDDKIIEVCSISKHSSKCIPGSVGSIRGCKAIEYSNCTRKKLSSKKLFTIRHNGLIFCNFNGNRQAKKYASSSLAIKLCYCKHTNWTTIKLRIFLCLQILLFRLQYPRQKKESYAQIKDISISNQRLAPWEGWRLLNCQMLYLREHEAEHFKSRIQPAWKWAPGSVKEHRSITSLLFWCQSSVNEVSIHLKKIT